MAMDSKDGTSSAIKGADLGLFREQSIARARNLIHTGGDVFQVCVMPSDMSVLWGESYGAKERKFLREMLTIQQIAFSLKETYQIHLRSVFHASANSGMTLANGFRRKGLCALLLHDLTGELTTSWTFSKFIRPLYRVGFSVLAPDFPGFGKSSVARVPSCSVSLWKEQCAHVISKIMEEMSVPACQMLAVGHTCGMLLHTLQSMPHRMAKDHVLINPIFDRMELFHHVGIEPPPGAKAGWQDVIKAKQQAALIDLLRTSNVRLWCLFDKDQKYKGLDKPNMTKEERHQNQCAYDTYEMLLQASKNEYIARNIKITVITTDDLCEAQAGKKIPVRILIPSRHLKCSIARYMGSYRGKGKAIKYDPKGNEIPGPQWQELFMSNHIAYQKGLSRKAKRERGQFGLDHMDEYDERGNLIEKASSDEDSEYERDDDPIKSLHERALAIPGLDKKHKKTVIAGGGIGDDPGHQEHHRAQQRAIDPAQHHKDIRAKLAAQRHGGILPGSSNGMARSASEAAMLDRFNGNNKISRHSLSAAAHLAQDRLHNTGTGTNPFAASRAKVATTEAKQIDWAKVPFEPDLSYGVRKQLLDSLEASVETYKEEAEKEFQALNNANQRRGFRMF